MQSMEQSPDAPESFPKNFLSGKTVLMIDAEVEQENLFKVYKYVLHDTGEATIVACRTIQKALDYLKDADNPKPDLIWLGDVKESLSGQTQFCQWAKRYNQPTRHIPLLVVSTLGMGSEKEKRDMLADAGANAVLRKACFSLDELFGTLKELLTPGTTVTKEREHARDGQSRDYSI